MIFRLALKDLYFDRLMSICIIAAMTAVIAPLLLLFSLRYGIISTLENNLKNNPLNLEVRMLSGYKLEQDFFDAMKVNPHVEFVVPMTRSLSVTGNVSCNGQIKTNVDAIPTAANDPLMKLSNIDDNFTDDEVAVSKTLSDDLNIKVGDTLKLVISRVKDNVAQNGIHEFKVKGIVAERFLGRNALFVTLNTLIAMEDYKDGFEPLIFSDGSYQNTVRTSFAKARIYAKSIDDVPPLSKELRQKFSIQDKLSDIENVKAIGRVLGFVFYTIAITSVVGGAIALAGLIFSNIGTKSSSFALLRLTGFSGKDVTTMILYESITLAFLAYAFALGLFYAGQACFNLYFGSLLSNGTVVSTLVPIHIVAGLGLTLGVSLVIALVCAKVRIIKITIASALREVK